MLKRPKYHLVLHIVSLYLFLLPHLFICKLRVKLGCVLDVDCNSFSDAFLLLHQGEKDLVMTKTSHNSQKTSRLRLHLVFEHLNKPTEKNTRWNCCCQPIEHSEGFSLASEPAHRATLIMLTFKMLHCSLWQNVAVVSDSEMRKPSLSCIEQPLLF